MNKNAGNALTGIFKRVFSLKTTLLGLGSAFLAALEC